MSVRDLAQTAILALYRVRWGRVAERAFITFCAVAIGAIVSLVLTLIRTGDPDKDVTFGQFITSSLYIVTSLGVGYWVSKLWKRAVIWAIAREQLPDLVAKKLEGDNNFGPGYTMTGRWSPLPNATATPSPGGTIQIVPNPGASSSWPGGSP